jgi:hypothetical protein
MMPLLVMLTMPSTSTPSPSPVTPVPMMLPRLTTVATWFALKPSRLMPAPLLPRITPPASLVTCIV